MFALTLTALALLALAAAWRYPRWQLARALAVPIDPARLAILRHNLPAYQGMPPALQEQLHKLVQQFLHQKTFIGCAGLDITDEIRVTIAAHACMLLLNRHSKVYPALHTVLVYPSAFLVPRNQVDAAGVVTPGGRGLLGESWGDGRVILSWEHVQKASDRHREHHGQNVVLHEFAHQLDSESGSNNGAPYLGDPARYARWSQVLAHEFEVLRQDAWVQQYHVLDHYGASSPAEFFAVATETFFENPYPMAQRHPELFAEFAHYYAVDPRDWHTAPLATAHDGFDVFPYGQW